MASEAIAIPRLYLLYFIYYYSYRKWTTTIKNYTTEIKNWPKKLKSDYAHRTSNIYMVWLLQILPSDYNFFWKLPTKTKIKYENEIWKVKSLTFYANCAIIIFVKGLLKLIVRWNLIMYILYILNKKSGISLTTGKIFV